MPTTAVRAGSHSCRVAILVGMACAGCTGERMAAMLPFETYRNVSASMEPTIRAGMTIVAFRFTDSLNVIRDVGRGDVVVHQIPTDTANRYIKRIVGMPGDTIAMRGGVVSVNAIALAEPYAQHTVNSVDHVLPDVTWQLPYLVREIDRAHRPTQNAWGPLVIPAGAYLLLGDNRDNSLDSRYYGLVAAKFIRARIPSEVLAQLGTRSHEAH